MSDTFDTKKFGAMLSIPFTKSNLTTGESNSDFTVNGGVGTEWVAPRAGSVVAISAVTQAITDGTITLKPHKAGTEYAEKGVPAPALSSTQDTNGTYATVSPGALTFAAGDRLGISAVSTTTLSPTNTLDVDAFLFVQLNP